MTRPTRATSLCGRVRRTRPLLGPAPLALDLAEHENRKRPTLTRVCWGWQRS